MIYLLRELSESDLENFKILFNNCVKSQSNNESQNQFFEIREQICQFLKKCKDDSVKKFLIQKISPENKDLNEIYCAIQIFIDIPIIFTNLYYNVLKQLFMTLRFKSKTEQLLLVDYIFRALSIILGTTNFNVKKLFFFFFFCICFCLAKKNKITFA
jgi:hypothetical protein